MENSGNPNFIPPDAEREITPEQRVEFLGDQEKEPQGPEAGVEAGAEAETQGGGNEIVEKTQTGFVPIVEINATPEVSASLMGITRKTDEVIDVEDQMTQKQMIAIEEQLDANMRNDVTSYYQGAKDVSELRDRFTNKNSRSRLAA